MSSKNLSISTDYIYRDHPSKDKLKNTNAYGLTINHQDFVGINGDGLCAGLSMLWLFCMAKETNSYLSIGIKHFFTKISLKNKDEFLSLEQTKKSHFINIIRYINRNRKIVSYDKFFEQEAVKLRNSLLEFHTVTNTLFKTTVCGVCSLHDSNGGDDYKELLEAIIVALNSNKDREVFIIISSIGHAMALHVQKSNFNGLLIDDHYKFVFFEPNDPMGELMPVVFTSSSKLLSNQEIYNKFKLIFGKTGIRKNYFTNYSGYFYYNLFKLNDLKSYMKTNQNSLFSKDEESDRALKILGLRNYLNKDDESIRLFYLLFKSCALGLFSVVNALKKFPNIDPNKVNSNGLSALYIAAQNGHSEVVKALKKFPNIDPNKISSNGVSALYIAAQNGHSEVIKALKEFPNIDPNKISSNGVSALYIAAQNGYSGAVKALKEFPNIDPNKISSNGVSALFIAAEKGYSEVVNILKEFKNIDPNQTNSNGASALYMASQNGHSEIVKALKEFQNIDPNLETKNGTTPLLIAVQNGHLETVNLLIEFKNIDLNKTNNEGISALGVVNRVIRNYNSYLLNKDILKPIRVYIEIKKVLLHKRRSQKIRDVREFFKCLS